MPDDPDRRGRRPGELHDGIHPGELTRRRRPALARRVGARSRPVANVTDRRARARRRRRAAASTPSSTRAGAWYPRWYWPSFAAPGPVWLAVFFVLPFYVVLSRRVRHRGPDLPQPAPRVRALVVELRDVLTTLQKFTAGDQSTWTRLIRTLALRVRRQPHLPGGRLRRRLLRGALRRAVGKALFLVLLVAPFWISYLMRIYAWQSLLQPDGYVNDFLRLHLRQGPGRLAGGQADHGDPRARVRLHPVHDPAALRLPRPHQPEPAGGRPRPGRQPVPDVPARHAAAVEARDPRRARHRVAADVRRLLHEQPARRRRRPRCSAT